MRNEVKSGESNGYAVPVPIWVIAHLYDRYGTFLIGLTNIEEARRYNYYRHAQYPTLEAAEDYVHIRLQRIEDQSLAAYDKGDRHVPRTTRQPDSPFLRHVMKDALQNMEYDGWVEVA